MYLLERFVKGIISAKTLTTVILIEILIANALE